MGTIGEIIMYKVDKESSAKELATKHNLAYGHCVFNGHWYVGTTPQLQTIGVVIKASMELI